MKRLTQEQYRISDWFGGKTIEIAIGPEGANYADRDFLWRLSSATVDLDESDFTALPDYMRWIAPLRGKMRLVHGDAGEAILLNEYDTDYFDGGINTHSWGRCTDFNLMLRKGRCDGRIDAQQGRAGDERLLEPCGDGMVLYCAAGRAEVAANGVCMAIGEKEGVQFAPGEAAQVKLRFTADGCVMTARMHPLD